MRHTPEQVAAIPADALAGHGERHAELALASDLPYLVGYDFISLGDVPRDGQVYFEYVDGAWPNAYEVNATWPADLRPTITVGFGEAQIIDCEPGNASWDGGPLLDQIAEWFANRKAAGVKPGLYISASYAAEAVDGLAARGWPREEWILAPAHWTNERHVCGYAICGYPDADYTQWAGNVNNQYDIDEITPGCFDLVPPSPVIPKPTEPEVKTLTYRTGPADSEGFAYTAATDVPKDTGQCVACFVRVKRREAAPIGNGPVLNCNPVVGPPKGQFIIRVSGLTPGETALGTASFL